MCLTVLLAPPQDTRRGQNNADGFGIGFYTDPKLGTAPCLFTSTTPAWNCANLQRLASKTASRLIFAHVRATTEGSLSEDNCHPFCHGNLMWMHNGGLGGWKQIKRRLGERLADKWYLGVAGGTDSEWAFALFLDTLERMGYDPSSQPAGGFGPTVLRKAMLKTIAIINELIDAIPESVIHADNIDTRSLLNFALTDGHSVICTRYVGSASDEAASLYYSSGTMWETRTQDPNKRDFQMARNDKDADVVLVASEPLTFERGASLYTYKSTDSTNNTPENWVNVPTNSILTVHKQTVMVHPIMDRFYDRNPHHRRSAAYVRNKGLAANEKGSVAGLVPTPVGTPSIEIDAPKKLAPTLPFRTPRTTDTSTVPRVRTPLSHIEPAPGPKDPGDVRSITAPPAMRSSQQPAPSQGNIKKKRASLTAIEPFSSHLNQDSSPITPEPTRTEFGNPNKIAQFFPELSMS